MVDFPEEYADEYVYEPSYLMHERKEAPRPVTPPKYNPTKSISLHDLQQNDDEKTEAEASIEDVLLEEKRIENVPPQATEILTTQIETLNQKMNDLIEMMKKIMEQQDSDKKVLL